MKNFLINMITLLSTLLVLFILFEVILRISGFNLYSVNRNESDFIQPDPLTSYRYTSALDTIVTNENYSVRVQTNQFGYRDDEWNLKTKDLKILVVGNSFTAGFGVEKKNRWSDILSNSLSNIEVYNAAVSGYSLKQSVTTAISLNELVNPDMIILGMYLDGSDRILDPFVFFEGYSVRKSQIPFSRVHQGDLFFLQSKNKLLQNTELFFLKHSTLYNFILNRLRVLKNYIMTSRQSSFEKIYPLILKELNRLQTSIDVQIYLLPIIQHDLEFNFSNSELSLYAQLKTYSDTSALSFLNILPAFDAETKKKTDFWIGTDAHWNNKAHALASKEIIKSLHFD